MYAGHAGLSTLAAISCTRLAASSTSTAVDAVVDAGAVASVGTDAVTDTVDAVAGAVAGAGADTTGCPLANVATGRAASATDAGEEGACVLGSDARPDARPDAQVVDWMEHMPSEVGALSLTRFGVESMYGCVRQQ
jgi:hypothetical protein